MKNVNTIHFVVHIRSYPPYKPEKISLPYTIHVTPEWEGISYEEAMIGTEGMVWDDLAEKFNISKTEVLKRFYAADLTQEKIVGGYGDGKPDNAFNPVQLAKGVKVEMEHTKDPRIAKEIAKDHLTEYPDYYKELEKMERKLEKKNVLRTKKTNSDLTLKQLRSILDKMNPREASKLRNALREMLDKKKWPNKEQRAKILRKHGLKPYGTITIRR